MKIISIFLGAILLPVLVSCTSSYYNYSGAKPMVGNGGASKSISGIDIWVEGSPQRKFLIIGTIQDSRPGRGIPMLLRDGRLASIAKEKGGDAILLRYEEREHVGSVTSMQSSTSGSSTAYSNGTATAYNQGYATRFSGQSSTSTYGNSNTSGTAATANVVVNHSKFYVIKYL